MDDIFKRILDALQGADFWIAVLFLVAGYVCWLSIGTRKEEQPVLRRRIGAAIVLALLAGAAFFVNHAFFQREHVFSKNLTGILVMRMVGDDALNSLQAKLVATLNVELQKDSAVQEIEVHAGREEIDQKAGLAAAHARARAIGQTVNAKLVIWGPKTGEKAFYPCITVLSAPEAWSPTTERTHDAEKMDELHLPEELVDEPLYLSYFSVGYSFYNKRNYKDALPHFEAALERHVGGSPNEIADLRFFIADCDYSLGFGQKDMATKFQEGIELNEKAAKAYKNVDQKKWTLTQINLGIAYSRLPTRNHAANLQKAIDAYDAVLGVLTEKDDPVSWARTQNNLGAAYAELPGDRAANLQMAIKAFAAALGVRTEKDFPVDWAMTLNNLGYAYSDLPVGDRSANLQKAIDYFEKAQSVLTEKDFPVEWALTQNNFGYAYGYLSEDRAANLQKAIAYFDAALRVRTEKDFPVDWAETQYNLGVAYDDDVMPGDLSTNRQKAIGAYEAAARVRTEQNFPVEWAQTLSNLGVVYVELSTGNRATNLKKAI